MVTIFRVSDMMHAVYDKDDRSVPKYNTKYKFCINIYGQSGTQEACLDEGTIPFFGKIYLTDGGGSTMA